MGKAPGIIKERGKSTYGEHDWRQAHTSPDERGNEARANYRDNYDEAFATKEDLELVEEKVGTKTVVKSKRSATATQARGGGRCRVGTTESGKRPVFVTEEEEQRRWGAIDWSN